jgi:hypothetical protein
MINRIGIAGQQGFGVGTCPGSLPTGMAALSGTDDVTGENYGNYQFQDGSAMVWIPAFYYKIGTGRNGLALNQVDVQPFCAYDAVAESEAAGYALHRAFHDGGVRDGFFIDKYLCSNNDGIASSLKSGSPLSTWKDHNPLSALNGKPTNAYHGVIAAAKTRGPAFFAASQFQRAALALLALAHAQAATSTDACAWYDPKGVTSFPKGCNSGDFGDVYDQEIAYEPEGYSNCGKTGSATPFARTTHNGQASGVADLNGLMWEVSPGLTAASDTGQYFVLAPSARMKDMTAGAGKGPRDLWGTATQLLAAGYEPVLRESQILSEATAGRGWQDTGLGIPQHNTSRWVKPSFEGTAEAEGEQGVPGMCPIAGGSWSTGANAGVWALHLDGVRTASSSDVGFRAALYLG